MHTALCFPVTGAFSLGSSNMDSSDVDHEYICLLFHLTSREYNLAVAESLFAILISVLWITVLAASLKEY